MTTTLESPTTARPRNPIGCLKVTVPSAVGGSLAVWVVSRLGGVDLVVRTGDTTRTVGWLSVLVASAVAAAAGTALLAFLEPRVRRARTIWTWLATAGYLVSLVAGPLSATTTTAAICLAAMHTVVWVALVGSAWRRR
jgi:hypothetical protein